MQVRGVVNFCEEYQGPVAAYRRLGIQQLRLPTADHFEPSLADLQTCVRFIRRHQAQGQRVYVHCRAGHGRSAAGVLAWLLAQDAQGADLHTWNERLSAKRNVRQSLWKQPNMRRFYDNLRKEEGDTGNDEDWK
jgi:atypical dual specificity phosphatase